MPRKLYRVKIQKEAIDDLEQIYRFVLQDKSNHGKRFLKTLKEKAFSLRRFPRRGARLPILEDQESLREVRFLEHQGYLIFYTIEKAEVVILHFSRPGQDWVHLF